MGYVVLAAVILAWAALCIYVTWQEERKKNWKGPTPKRIEKLLQEDLPPMHGFESDGKGGWRRF